MESNPLFYTSISIRCISSQIAIAIASPEHAQDHQSNTPTLFKDQQVHGGGHAQAGISTFIEMLPQLCMFLDK